jgi:hypothetical protein
LTIWKILTNKVTIHILRVIYFNVQYETNVYMHAWIHKTIILHNKIWLCLNSQSIMILIDQTASDILYCIGDVQPLPWNSKDKEIFAMLDDICIANKQNPLSMSSNMATVTKLADHLYSILYCMSSGACYRIVRTIYSVIAMIYRSRLYALYGSCNGFSTALYLWGARYGEVQWPSRTTKLDHISL